MEGESTRSHEDHLHEEDIEESEDTFVALYSSVPSTLMAPVHDRMLCGDRVLVGENVRNWFSLS